MIGLTADVVIFNTTATIYVGMFLYIHGMRDDTKNRLTLLIEISGSKSNQSVDQINIWSNYVHEIDQHAKIIEYLTKKLNTFGLFIQMNFLSISVWLNHYAI